jgi:hypothetical protein
MSLDELKAQCQIPSKDCDIKVQNYCRANPSDTDFCGCSTNVLADISDPKFGNSPVKCWAKSCTQNANAYQFFSFQTDTCAPICIDNSSVTVLGSNLSDSSFNQASCGSQNITQNDTALKTTISQLYEYGSFFASSTLSMFIVLIISISIVCSLLPVERV